MKGVSNLCGAPVYATDLRAGAALIIAGICANGVTEIYNLENILIGAMKILKINFEILVLIFLVFENRVSYLFSNDKTA